MCYISKLDLDLTSYNPPPPLTEALTAKLALMPKYMFLKFRQRETKLETCPPNRSVLSLTLWNESWENLLSLLSLSCSLICCVADEMTGEVLDNHNKDPIIFDIFQKQCCWSVSSQWTVISCHSSGHTPLIAHPLRNTIQIGYQSHAAMCHCYLCHNNIGDILPEDTSLNACMQFSWETSLLCICYFCTEGAIASATTFTAVHYLHTLTGGRSWV